jgi:alkanesulfonate monooxygenase SsuD/methylene tetrahydromethanopterin reductase-like flavin-dependent oxidoreductase (luciferase family)
MFAYVTGDAEEARRLLEDVVAPTIRRDPDELRERLLVGTPDRCAGLLRAYGDAGAQGVCVWPVADEVRQLEVIANSLLPLASG